MLKRIVVAVIEGAVVGGVVATGLGALGLPWSSANVAFGAALVTGVVTGLVAGKPPWVAGATVEVLLKTVVGAFIATGAVYGARKWLTGVTFGLESTLGGGGLGAVPAVLLPIVATAIALLLEIDDAVGPHVAIGPGAKRVGVEGARGAQVSLEAADVESDGSSEAGHSEARRGR